MSTPYHAKLWAMELERRAEIGSSETFARALSDAKVDLNPHQVSAAMFAVRSPIAAGAILADEVGLGKTIEASLLLAQKWAERKRRLLVIVPANLRKQWSVELMDKFHLPSVILENKDIKLQAQQGNFNPFRQDAIVIVSYNFAAKNAHYINPRSGGPGFWDMVVVDEAHRLRNVYKKGNKQAQAIKQALEPFFKVLLTATPLQNSLLELYGLVSIIDEYQFGSLEGFKARYAQGPLEPEVAEELRERLLKVCKRSLRRDVKQFVKFTDRRALVQDFAPNPDEIRLYGMVDEYLQRPRLYALPDKQRALMTMVLRKLLASSSFAIAHTLEGLCLSLDQMIKHGQGEVDLTAAVAEDVDDLPDLIDEWEEDEDDDGVPKVQLALSPAEVAEAKLELAKLKEYAQLAGSVSRNSKGKVLLEALNVGFAAAAQAQAGQATIHKKAIIFTESKRTQSYILTELEQSEYKGRVVLFNGSNSDDHSKAIYARWLADNPGQASGSKSADMRAALVDYFRNSADIMIATEAAAEGINLQFCNLVINYDLPWNPQRIEQRIGRCHRYGQKCDVVVVNFVNKSNAADQRVYELLQAKFMVFDSVFGATDEVLGQVDVSGVGFERRVMQIIQACRTPEAIQEAFEKLESENGQQIAQAKQQAKVDLIRHFDQSVINKVRIDAERSLDEVARKLWSLTRFVLKDVADFDDEIHRFNLRQKVVSLDEAPLGSYELSKDTNAMVHLYRVGHPLALEVIQRGLSAPVPSASLTFDLSGHAMMVASLSNFRGRSGWLRLAKLSYDYPGSTGEDHLLVSACLDSGEALPEDSARALFELKASITGSAGTAPAGAADGLNSAEEVASARLRQGLDGRNQKFMREEITKVEAWTADQQAKFRSHYVELEKKFIELGREIARCTDFRREVELEEEKSKIRTRMLKEEDAYRQQVLLLEEKSATILKASKLRLSPNETLSPVYLVRWTLA
jgi:superfamily II DNA or RNA helicase